MFFSSVRARQTDWLSVTAVLSTTLTIERYYRIIAAYLAYSEQTLGMGKRALTGGLPYR